MVDRINNFLEKAGVNLSKDRPQTTTSTDVKGPVDVNRLPLVQYGSGHEIKPEDVLGKKKP